MTRYQLDDLDKQLLGLLQENARYTATELAEEAGVSDNTIHNRIDRLEEAGIITGYTATVDHAQLGLDLHFQFSGTARISDRATVAEDVLDHPQVLEVTELMSGERNILVKMVGAEDADITRVAGRLDDLAMQINDENLIKAEHVQTLDYTATEIEEMLSRVN